MSRAFFLRMFTLLLLLCAVGVRGLRAEPQARQFELKRSPVRLTLSNVVETGNGSARVLQISGSSAAESQRLSRAKVFSLSNPGRLVIDLPLAATGKGEHFALHDLELKELRVGYHNESTRIVVELNGSEQPLYSLEADHGLTITIGDASAVALQNSDGAIVKRDVVKADSEGTKPRRQPPQAVAVIAAERTTSVIALKDDSEAQEGVDQEVTPASEWRKPSLKAVSVVAAERTTSASTAKKDPTAEGNVDQKDTTARKQKKQPLKATTVVAGERTTLQAEPPVSVVFEGTRIEAAALAVQKLKTETEAGAEQKQASLNLKRQKAIRKRAQAKSRRKSWKRMSAAIVRKRRPTKAYTYTGEGATAAVMDIEKNPSLSAVGQPKASDLQEESLKPTISVVLDQADFAENTLEEKQVSESGVPREADLLAGKQPVDYYLGESVREYLEALPGDSGALHDVDEFDGPPIDFDKVIAGPQGERPFNWPVLLSALAFVSLGAFVLFQYVKGHVFQLEQVREAYEVSVQAIGHATRPLISQYELLGCREGDSEAEIKAKYKRLVKVFHTDSLSARELPEELLELSNERFRKIQEAYEAVRQERGFQ